MKKVKCSGCGRDLNAYETKASEYDVFKYCSACLDNHQGFNG